MKLQYIFTNYIIESTLERELIQIKNEILERLKKIGVSPSGIEKRNRNIILRFDPVPNDKTKSCYIGISNNSGIDGYISAGWRDLEFDAWDDICFTSGFYNLDEIKYDNYNHGSIVDVYNSIERGLEE